MLQILNKTPFETGLSLFTDPRGSENACVAVKATFRMQDQKHSACLAPTQKPVLYMDEYFDTPGQSSVKYPADVVMGKPNTDIGVVGYAHCPGGKPLKRLPVSLTVGNLDKRIMVHGDRTWVKRGLLGGFAISDPLPFVRMPLRYELAFGGADRSDKNARKHAMDPRNPVGTGFRSHEGDVAKHRLPNLEDPDQPIKTWRCRPRVAGYGFMDGSWSQRLQFAGTYDENWQDEQFPLLPADFDPRFFNAAHPDLIAKGFLKGGEPARLNHLCAREEIRFALPKIDIHLMFRLGESRNEVPADLWTVAFLPDEELFYMVWGGVFDVGKQPSRMQYVRVEMDGSVAEK